MTHRLVILLLAHGSLGVTLSPYRSILNSTAWLCQILELLGSNQIVRSFDEGLNRMAEVLIHLIHGAINLGQHVMRFHPWVLISGTAKVNTRANCALKLLARTVQIVKFSKVLRLNIWLFFIILMDWLSQAIQIVWNRSFKERNLGRSL